MAAPAMASSPNPIPGTTKVDSIITNADGSHTVTIEGEWNWTTGPNCPTTRNGAGYQVDWFDGNTANPIGTPKSPDGVLHVGDSTDNIVHSLDTLGGSNSPTGGDASFDGVPSSYLTHNATNSTPTTNDSQNWVSNCSGTNPATHLSSGTWGPISHVYAPGVASFTLCAIMYDPHGTGTPRGGVIGSSNIWTITAGGTVHNTDNSYENSGSCPQSTFPILPRGGPSFSPVPEPATTRPATTATGWDTAMTNTKSTGSGKGTGKKKAPLLRWTAVRGASYYNFQLYRGDKKILSIWLTHACVQLSSSWRFNGRGYRLAPGRYRWYAWSGFGTPAAERFGPPSGPHKLAVARLS